MDGQNKIAVPEPRSARSARHSADRHTALAALQGLSSQVRSAAQAIDSDFQELSAGNATSGNSFDNIANCCASGTMIPNQHKGTSPNGQSTAPPSANSNANSIGNSATQKAKGALSKLILYFA